MLPINKYLFSLNKILKIHLIFNPCLNRDEGEYTIFPLNDVNEKQRNNFVSRMKSIGVNINLKTEIEKNITLTQ